MPDQQPAISIPQTTESFTERYQRIRLASENLCATLETEDFCIQTMDDVSPLKWHLAHTAWFFETVVLKPHLDGYQEFHPRYAYLFNSYYESLGARHARPQRGILSRPTVAQTMAYRAHVDAAMLRLLEQSNEEVDRLSEIGLNHEQQHQELMLMDIKHVFANNPLQPAYCDASNESGEALPLSWLTQPEGIREIGFAGRGFSYDNEGPRHRVWLDAYAIANRPVTNGEYRAFIDDGGYRDARLWLSDAWTLIQNEQWQAPLYWENRDGEWWHYTLQGARLINDSEPVAHLSLYEADAYARWASARLPTEAEWEATAGDYAITGDFIDNGPSYPNVHPQALSPIHPGAVSGFFYGGVWEWTASSYAAYPGYQLPAGPLGEYNAKFMCSQSVLRGGSCATPVEHIRESYRNFFYPQQQWQFSGLRLAKHL